MRDEHQLIGDVLTLFMQHQVLPGELLPPDLISPVQIAVAHHDNSRAKDVWSTVGGAIKPSFELVLTTAGDALPFAELPPSRRAGRRHMVAPRPRPAADRDAGQFRHRPPRSAARRFRRHRARRGQHRPVIDGVTARVVGLPDHHVTSRPAVLPLFPDSAGRLTLTLGVPPGFPAGRHPVTVEVRSRQADTVPAYLDVDLLVPSTPDWPCRRDPRSSGRIAPPATC